MARGSNGGEVGGESGRLASSQGPHQAGRARAVSTAGGSWDSAQEAEAEVAGCSHNQLKLFCTQKTKQMRKEAHGSITSLFVKQGINQRLCLALQALWIRVKLTPTKQTMYYYNLSVIRLVFRECLFLSARHHASPPESIVHPVVHTIIEQ